MSSESNSGSGGQNLSNDDFDVMVDMGYGRKMSASKIAGAVGFSGAKVQLSESGEMKFAFAAARDALNLVSEALNNGDNGGGSGGGEDRPFGQPDFEQSSQSSEANLLEFSDNLDGQPRMIGGAGALEYISVGGIVKGVNLLKNIFTAIKGGKKTIWVYGSFKSSSKWANQLAKRGWTEKQITEAITKGKSHEAVNMVNKANGATRYVHPTTGQSVVIDDVTKELLHVGGKGFKY